VGNESNKTLGAARPDEGGHATHSEQARGTELRDRVFHREGLPLEEVSGHRKTDRRIADVKKFHRPSDSTSPLACHSGTLSVTLSAKTRKVNDPLVVLPCTKVISN
jgi:hypothetical protein